ncbi:hypothetical protein [Albidovulum aquaemixtae]|uniref:hypothetical protein n=1 Tax=Albidovulum aquaemixtae TaxID=1542388 RepID=UPI001C62EC6A|nr:hypothetical protein [Defluviimonas aquaemixtae]
MNSEAIDKTADTLAAMYVASFGGKASGRYRIARKLICGLMGRRRLYAEDVQELTRAVFERGYLLIDMESFFAVLSANAFVNYRRANRDCLTSSERQ